MIENLKSQCGQLRIIVTALRELIEKSSRPTYKERSTLERGESLLSGTEIMITKIEAGYLGAPSQAYQETLNGYILYSQKIVSALRKKTA
ncbi:hypothetical protein [Ferrimonas marina]|uniref:Four helix bundle protein n=1 Tax=Ferrimonas marina TaxID=299255 RepID=A0A1M5UEL7_9GAMM|nr:hypothetical protein [Ferrimonas marina]SHH61409.1 hypothetical protein SAMN02745129_2531 [Ferrimonas marina]